jgi:hypothetical protein
MHLLLGKDLFQLSNLVSWWLYLECWRSSILPKALGVLILQNKTKPTKKKKFKLINQSINPTKWDDDDDDDDHGDSILLLPA